MSDEPLDVPRYLSREYTQANAIRERLMTDYQVTGDVALNLAAMVVVGRITEARANMIAAQRTLFERYPLLK